MGRFSRAPTLPADADPAERLVLATEQISRLQARISTLEQALEAETRLRLEASTQLAAERLHRRQAPSEPDQAREGTDRAVTELEAAWSQIHQLRAALERQSRPWWRRGRRS